MGRRRSDPGTIKDLLPHLWPEGEPGDTRTEKEIQSSLDEVARGRTTLVIAHRLSTVVDADEVLVLDGGRIVELGSHDALLAADGLYADMWRRQQEAERREEEPVATDGSGRRDE